MTTPFPNGLIGTKVEIFYDGEWNDITADVRGLGADDGEIEIGTRGVADESNQLTSTITRLSVNNNDGSYSYRNVSGPLYGKIGPNTPLRIAADVSSVDSVIDHFSVDSASGWPNAESGHDYTHSGGAATQFIVTGGEGVHRHTGVSTTYTTFLDEIFNVDFDIYVRNLRAEADVTGGGFVEFRLHARVDGGDRVQLFVLWSTGAASQIGYRIRNNFSTISSNNESIAGATHDDFTDVRLQIRGTVVKVKGWLSADTEPDEWNFETTTPNILPGSIEIETSVSSGVTNAFPFDVTLSELNIGLGIILITGEVVEWPKRWDGTGNDVWAPLTIAGPTRRLRQGNVPLRSALYRVLSKLDLLGYWDMENRSTSEAIVSTGITGVATQFLFSIDDGASLTPSADALLMGSGSLPVAGVRDPAIGSGVAIKAPQLLPSVSGANHWSLIHFTHCNLWSVDIDCNAAILASITITGSPEVAGVVFTTRYEDVAGVDQIELTALVIGVSATILTVTTNVAFTEDKWRMIRLSVDDTGADLRVRLYVDEVLAATGSVAGVVGTPRAGQLTTSVNNTQLTLGLGHWAVASGVGTDALVANGATILSASGGYAGETSVERFERLMDELIAEGENLTYEVIDSTDNPDTTLMGPQTELNIVDLISQPAQTNDGLIYELRHELGYGFRTRQSLFEGSIDSPDITLDYTADELSGSLEITDDDEPIRNKITVKRMHGGETATVEQTTGPLSTASPVADPPGAGQYETSVSPDPNLDDPVDLIDYAGMRLLRGTWDESRWPAIKLMMERAPFTGNMAQLLAAVLLEIGDLISVIHIPSWIGPDDAFHQLRGVSMFLSNFNWGLQWTSVPAGPYVSLGALSSPAYGRLDTHGSTTVFDVDDNDTELVVFTEEPNLPFCDVVWTEDLGELSTHDSDGIDLRLNPSSRAGGLGGEKVNVPLAYELTDTFTRSNGVLTGTLADTGQTWALVDGPSAEIVISSNKMRMAHDSVNDILWSSIDAGVVDQCLQVDMTFASDTALTSNIEVHIGLRHTDANNNYVFRIILIAGSNDVALRLQKTVASVTTQLTSQYTYLDNVAATTIRFKGMVIGRWIAGKIWRPDLIDEPEWQVSMMDAASEMMTATSVSIRSRLESGNTNTLNYNIEFDNLSVHSAQIRPSYYDYWNRTTVNGLGTATSGGAWTTFGSGGVIAATDYQVVPNNATVLLAAASNIRAGYLDDVDLYDVCVSFVLTCPLPTGASILCHAIFRGVDTSNYIMMRMTINTAGAITIEFRSVIAGVSALLGSQVSIGWITHIAATPLKVKILGTGDQLAAKVWIPSTTKEPSHWHVTATDTVNSTGFVGFRFDRNAGNTNVNPTPTVADFKVENPQRITVDRGENGISRAWDAGTDVRLWNPLILGR